MNPSYFFSAAFAFILSASTAQAICADSDDMCEMEGGSYHLKLPYEVTEPAPVVVFLHGYGGSGRNTINIDRMDEPLLARGYAVLAPNG